MDAFEVSLWRLFGEFEESFGTLTRASSALRLWAAGFTPPPSLRLASNVVHCLSLMTSLYWPGVKEKQLAKY